MDRRGMLQLMTGSIPLSGVGIAKISRAPSLIVDVDSLIARIEPIADRLFREQLPKISDDLSKSSCQSADPVLTVQRHIHSHRFVEVVFDVYVKIGDRKSFGMHGYGPNRLAVYSKGTGVSIYEGSRWDDGKLEAYFRFQLENIDWRLYEVFSPTSVVVQDWEGASY